MANAACLAGAAFSNSMVGLVHTWDTPQAVWPMFPMEAAMSIFCPMLSSITWKRQSLNVARLLFPLAGAEEFCRTPPATGRAAPLEVIRSLRQTLFELCGFPAL